MPPRRRCRDGGGGEREGLLPAEGDQDDGAGDGHGGCQDHPVSAHERGSRHEGGGGAEGGGFLCRCYKSVTCATAVSALYLFTRQETKREKEKEG